MSSQRFFVIDHEMYASGDNDVWLRFGLFVLIAVGIFGWVVWDSDLFAPSIETARRKLANTMLRDDGADTNRVVAVAYPKDRAPMVGYITFSDDRVRPSRFVARGTNWARSIRCVVEYYYRLMPASGVNGQKWSEDNFPVLCISRSKDSVEPDPYWVWGNKAGDGRDGLEIGTIAMTHTMGPDGQWQTFGSSVLKLERR